MFQKKSDLHNLEIQHRSAALHGWGNLLRLWVPKSWCVESTFQHEVVAGRNQGLVISMQLIASLQKNLTCKILTCILSVCDAARLLYGGRRNGWRDDVETSSRRLPAYISCDRERSGILSRRLSAHFFDPFLVINIVSFNIKWEGRNEMSDSNHGLMAVKSNLGRPFGFPQDFRSGHGGWMFLA